MPSATHDTAQDEKMVETPSTGAKSAASGQQHELVEDLPGKPCSKPVISFLDVRSMCLIYAACAVSLATVFVQQLAISLGQIKQLQVIDAMFTVMLMVMGQYVLFALLLVEARFGGSCLQAFDAILRQDVWGKLNLPFRAILLVLMLAGTIFTTLDKEFSYGSSSVSIGPPQGLNFGIYPNPGWPTSGNGLALAIDAYVPFWLGPQLKKAYGYNLYTVDNATAVMLDTPDPKYIQGTLQESLRYNSQLSASYTIRATVNATVSEAIAEGGDGPLLDPHGNSVASGPYHNTTLYLNGELCSSVMVPPSGSKFAYAAIFSCTQDQTFDSGLFNQSARGYAQTRRCYDGVWNVTVGSIYLVDATLSKDQSSCKSQELLTWTGFEIDWQMFAMVPEFNWVWWPRGNAIDTLPPLVASATWSRLVALEGPEALNRVLGSNGSHVVHSQDLSMYAKQSRDVQISQRVITLHPSPWLAVLIVVPAFIATLGLLVKIWLHRVPIGEGFGIVSVISGLRADPEQLLKLKGAGLSGSVEDKIRMRIDAITQSSDKAMGEVLVTLNGEGRSQLLQRKQNGRNILYA